MATHQERPRVKPVVGPDGAPISIADLPPGNTRRWVISRKAIVIAAVRGGIISIEQACSTYSLTIDEYLSWEATTRDHGLAGLRATKVQQYRGSGQRHPDAKLRKLQEAREAHEDAITIVSQVENSMLRLRIALADVAEQIDRHAAYAGANPLAAGIALALDELRKRSASIAHSLELLQARAQSAALEVAAAEERMADELERVRCQADPSPETNV